VKIIQCTELTYETFLMRLDSEMKKEVLIFVLATLIKGKNTKTQRAILLHLLTILTY